MLRDASQKQVIQKFSFIESLNVSRRIEAENVQVTEEIDIDQAFNFIPQVASNSSTDISEQAAVSSVDRRQDSAIVSTELKADMLANSYKDVSQVGMGEIIKYSELDNSVNNYAPKNPNYLGKLLFALACSYSLFVLWWLFGYQGSKFAVHIMGGKHIVLSQSDVEFIDHMERSLLSLDRELETKKSQDDEQNKVVYVPVYTPQKNTPTVSTPVTQPQPSQNSQANYIPTPQALKIPAPPPLPTPNSLPENNTSPGQDIGAVVTKPLVKHTLTGILELGVGKSAALIKVNGQTRRFWLGEEINNSGWILESITNQTAKINYQGQVRSISVGETF